MYNLEKIVFVSFQGIRNGSPLGVVKGIIPFITEINRKIKPKAIYYVSRVHKNTINEPIFEVSKLYRNLLLIINIVNKYFIKISGYKKRLIQERLFDFFIAQKIKEPTTLISTAYLYKATRKNKKLGGINIFLAGNPDDYEIHNLLKNEQKKYNVVFNDAYTYKKRIEFGSKSIFSYDHIITFSNLQYESFVKRISEKKISLIEHHIIPSEKTFPEINYKKKNILTFCFIAHPFWLKGLLYLLEAWSNINSNDVKLIVGGRIDKQMHEFINKNYSNLKNIEYTGWINDLNKFFRTSHICIIPSLLDAGPATVAEAMYCGLPVIVSTGCGARTLVKDGINGFTVPPGDSNAIADKMLWFANNRVKIDSMGKEARKTIDNLAENDQNKKVADHILHVIQKIQQR